MTPKSRLPAWLGCSVLVIAPVILLSCVVAAPLQALYYLATGWVWFLNRVVPNVTIDTAGFLTGVSCLAAFSFGLHVLLRWLASATNSTSPWRVRWTAGLTGLVIVMFAAGIAAVGMLHQLSWLIASPRPLIEGGIGPLAAQSKSSNNLKQLVLAAHNYNDVNQAQFPPGCTTDAAGDPRHGWLAIVLPHLEQPSLHDRIRFDRPWDAAENRSAYETSIPTLLIPYHRLPEREDGYALSHYAGNVRVLPPGRSLRFPADFRDGSSNTIFGGEVSAGLRPWGHPLNLRDPGRGIRQTPDAFAGPRDNGSTIFAMCDGSVRRIQPKISPAVLKALATPADGDDPGPDWDK